MKLISWPMFRYKLFRTIIYWFCGCLKKILCVCVLWAGRREWDFMLLCLKCILSSFLVANLNNKQSFNLLKSPFYHLLNSPEKAVWTQEFTMCEDIWWFQEHSRFRIYLNCIDFIKCQLWDKWFECMQGYTQRVL